MSAVLLDIAVIQKIPVLSPLMLHCNRSIASQNMIFHFGNDSHNPVHFSFRYSPKCANNICSHIAVSLLLIGLKEII